MAMLEEGYAPALIDNIGRMTGMPRGPLEMHDDVALDLSYKIAKQTALDLGDKYVPTEGADIVAKMVEGGRFGRKNGSGLVGAISVYVIGTLPSGKIGGVFTVAVET
jgi:3-hydroxyacyl-CoA dehydrogenase/enoyl-CoA hydratase/3-hydroxybutyryl-CoA epimerase